MSGTLKRRVSRLEDPQELRHLTVIGFVPDFWSRQEAEAALMDLARAEGVDASASVVPFPDDRRHDAALHWIGDARTLLAEIARSRKRIGVNSEKPQSATSATRQETPR